MRLSIFLAVVFLGILHRASSVPRGVLPPSAYAVRHNLSPQVPKAPAKECQNASSSGSQKCGTKTVTHEKTVITIERTVETEIMNGGKAQECKGCPDIGTTTKAPVTTPRTTPAPCTSTTPQTTTVPTTPATTTTKAPITSTTTPRTTTVPITSPTTTTTASTTSPTTPQTTTVPTTSPTTTTTASTTSPTTPQTTTVPTTSPTTTTTASTTSPTTPQTTTVPITPPTTSTTTPRRCNPVNCKLPDCMCETTKHPVDDIPQFVMLTFDDAVNQENMKFYQELLADPKRKNKVGGCRIAATFFASGDYLDYPSVNELHRMGNEIALHSISHQTDNGKSYWNGLDTEKWEREVVDERKMVAKYANVSEDDIRGLRGPFLFTGGDAGFRMLHRHFDYDCTLIHKRDGPYDAPVFPYTLDYGFQKPCMVKECPNDSYPGLWTVPLNYLFRKYQEGGVDKYGHCSMADACQPELKTSSETFEYLR
ncbi:mucin-17 [Ixodes scapularis]|uniref:mucin-17 n=1 Tax=Ixodes scapularis TaxID=6945 RepID=UPI001A9CC6AF|nr:mucin-17 [Ixodes scapularis]